MTIPDRVIDVGEARIVAAPRRSALSPRVRPIWATMAKRAIDLIGATTGLLLLSPVFLLVGILVKLQDGGPIFYRRRVMGAHGAFDAFKFRSMHPDADARLRSDPGLRKEFQRNFKLINDHRVTHLGTVLRKYSLDELPQLVNVLRGDMSLVGPRMITSQELEKYGEHQDLLLTVKPGLTGFWQVNGRQDIEYSQRVKMDIYYICHWSLALDILILLKTPWTVVKATGAR